MKKPWAIVLLILGGAAITTIISLATGLVFIAMSIMIPVEGALVLYILLAMFLFLVSYPFVYLRDFFKKKYNVNAPVFTICVCAPSLIAAEIVTLVYIAEPSENSSLALPLIFWLGTTAVFTFWMIVHACIAAARRQWMKR